MTVRSGVLLLVLWASAHADTLILRSGTRVAGRWWATDADVISFLVNDRLEHYSRSEVSEVVFGTAPTSGAPSVMAPDQIGAIYYQEDSGNLLALEQAEGVPHGSGQYWELEGARSRFRLKSDSKMLFVVEMPNGIAPNTFSLYPLATKGSARRTKAGTGNSPAMTIPLTARNVSGNIYVLVPVDGLPPGEYSFSPANSNNAYCFGVDPAVPIAR